MLTVPTLLDRLITLAHDGNNAAFARAHGISPQEVGNVVNGTGNGTMSYKRLDGYARKDGYALDIVLRPHTGDMVADALAHAKAAAVEARHILEYQETLTPEMERWLALLDALIEAGGNSPEVEYAPHSAAPTVQIEQKGPEFAHATLQGIRDFIETYGQQDALAALYGGDLSAVLSGDQEAETARLVHLACSLGYSAVWEVGPPVKLRIKAE